jgi:hypothetical protein
MTVGVQAIMPARIHPVSSPSVPGYARLAGSRTSHKHVQGRFTALHFALHFASQFALHFAQILSRPDTKAGKAWRNSSSNCAQRRVTSDRPKLCESHKYTHKIEQLVLGLGMAYSKLLKTKE